MESYAFLVYSISLVRWEANHFLGEVDPTYDLTTRLVLKVFLLLDIYYQEPIMWESLGRRRIQKADLNMNTLYLVIET